MERNLLRYYIYGIYKRTSDAYSSSAPENTSVKGWALKRDRKNTLFLRQCKRVFKSVFNEGEKNGCKSNPNTVSRNMRICTDETGQKRFRTNDYLNSCQISSYFSQLAAQSRHPDVVDEDLEQELH